MLHLAQELINTYGSPLYVYNAPTLRETIARITQAIPYPRTHLHFATVTNGNIALLQIFQQAGWGLHANTPGDIYLGLKAGFLPSQIVYSGSNLNSTEMEQVLTWGVTTLNLDSIAQLQLFCQVYQTLAGTEHTIPRLGLRLNLPDVTGDSRIGVRPNEFPEAIAIAAAAGLTISGLHFYRGTGTNATPAFTQVIDTVIDTAQTLPDWQYLDFGGGFGYPYHNGKVAFDWPLFGAELSQRLSIRGREIDLIVEPGRAAIAGCGTLLARVVSVKWQDSKQVVGVDTSIANLAVLSVHGGYREIITCKEDREVTQSPLHPTDICGNTTYSRDYLGKNCQLPALAIGDIIAILDVGAYGYAMSSHFLHRPRPAEILLDNSQHKLIRQREYYSVLLDNQVFN
ncbi:MAG TPA: decarboxylase [Cyanobacteria bacterium UBA8803]|nr:decarboxylase [Cyanobacteria bacterium UBA9273]HBL60813.1 decarboxylase [Cyanobacteria bacterium UBA8803]